MPERAVRDRDIISTLQHFRILSRDHLVEMFFASLHHPVSQANRTLKRLVRDGMISADKTRRMYLYKPNPGIKTNSAKTDHYLDIANFYLECKKYDLPLRFTIEPKLGEKSNPEPDVFMIWQRAPFFVELQRSSMSEKQWKDKLSRYEAYYYSESWKKLDWQPKDKPPVFPRLWIVGEQPQSVMVPFKVIQSRTVEEMLMMVRR